MLAWLKPLAAVKRLLLSLLVFRKSTKELDHSADWELVPFSFEVDWAVTQPAGEPGADAGPLVPSKRRFR
jgi:hypothetical protein